MIRTSKDRTINVTYLEAPIEKVWWSIATPEGNNSYLTYTASSTGIPNEPKIGDQFTLCYGDITNHPVVIECDYLRVFAVSDAYQSISPDGNVEHFKVRTSFHLEQVKEFVKLTLEVQGFTEDTHGQWFRECLEMGWRRSLMNLKSVLELGMDLRNEMFSYPRIGVVNCTVNEEQSKETGVAVGAGNYLMQVFPNSPAEVAGLQKGDVILMLDNAPTLNYAEFVRAISKYYTQSNPVQITYVRKGKRSEVRAKLSLEDTFTGLVDLEGTSFDEVREKRKRLAKQRSASGSIWKNKETEE